MAKTPKSQAKSSRKAGQQAKAKAKGGASRQDVRGQAFIDDESRREIAGVACAVAAVVLFVVAVAPTQGLVTSWLSNLLCIGLGKGAFILPVVLAIIAASLVSKRLSGFQMPSRIALGLLLLFVAVLVLLAVFTPGLTTANLDALFLRLNLISQGGYVGAAIAWMLLLLFGQTISAIIMFGVVLIALIIIVGSLSSVANQLRERKEARAAQEEEKRKEAEAARKLEGESLMPAKAGDATKLFARKGGKATHAAPSGDDAFEHMQTRPISRRKPTRATGPIGAAAQAAPSGAITRKLGKHTEEAGAQAAGATATKAQAKPSSLAAPKPSEGFTLPSMKLLKTTRGGKASVEKQETLRDTALLLQETLADFGVDARVVDWVAGPTVTLFKVDLPAGVRVSKVTNLQDDIALALAASGVRIFAPVPGTTYVGIEVPNVKRQNVLLGDVLPAAGAGPLQVAIGKDVEGNALTADLAKMPHLLIGGTTGSGKSVAINGMIMSILMRATPAEVRFIMIDPKRVEFTPYNDIPHLYVPVVTECREAASALAWAVAEMERRLKVFSKVGARNIGQYNAKVQRGDEGMGDEAAELPYIVIIIDELADLMMNVGKEVEQYISRLAQLARAAGIHMIVATQRPSTNVVTGLIKANITNRIAFNVASGIDSRVILDQTGAENLIGLGDMLFSKPEYAKPQRLQGCFVGEDEIAAVVSALKEQGAPDYHSEILQTNVMSLGDTMPDGSGGRASSDDPLVWEAAEIVVAAGFGSTSNIQRRLKVGYSRAGRIMDMLEEKGIVGPPNGSKPREVLVDTMELETLKAFELKDGEAGTGA